MGQSNDHGIKDIWIRTETPAAIWFDVAVDRAADPLGSLGDTSSKDGFLTSVPTAQRRRRRASLCPFRDGDGEPRPARSPAKERRVRVSLELGAASPSVRPCTTAASTAA